MAEIHVDRERVKRFLVKAAEHAAKLREAENAREDFMRQLEVVKRTFLGDKEVTKESLEAELTLLETKMMEMIEKEKSFNSTQRREELLLKKYLNNIHLLEERIKVLERENAKKEEAMKRRVSSLRERVKSLNARIASISKKDNAGIKEIRDLEETLRKIKKGEKADAVKGLKSEIEKAEKRIKAIKGNLKVILGDEGGNKGKAKKRVKKRRINS